MTAAQAQWGPALARLVHLGVLDGGDALGGAVTVERMSRSNEVALVRVADVPRLVLKRHRSVSGDDDAAHEEVGAYTWLGRAADVGWCAPPVVLAEPQLLVLRPVPDARSLHEAIAASASPECLLVALAELLAAVHNAPPDTRLLRPRRPWVLHVADGVLPDHLAPDPELRELASLVAATAPLRDSLTLLGDAWRPLAPIHGDVKFDNVLVSGHGRVPRLQLVDWELAGLGLPAWDVAGIVDGVLVSSLVATGSDWAAGLGVASRAVAAHARRVPASLLGPPEGLAAAAVARLVQSAFQLLAMRHTEPVGAEAGRAVFDGAVAVAERGLDPAGWPAGQRCVA